MRAPRSIQPVGTGGLGRFLSESSGIGRYSIRVNRGRAPAVLIALSLLLSSCAGGEPGRDDGIANERAGAKPTPEGTKAVVAAQTSSDNRIGSFKLWRAMKTVRKLAGAAGIGVRERATNNERRAALYIARRFESYGYKVHIQKFSVDGGTSRNVVARWPGSITHPFVIGAHLDTVPASPGANDNASGVAAMLEAARLSAGRGPTRYIRWVAFGSEEYGDDGTHHDGSKEYVRRLGPKGRKRTPGMLSVDMIADGKPLLTGSFGIGPRVLGRMVYRRITRNSGIRMRYQTLCDCSDNGPFEHAGIPGAFMYSGPEPDYHSPSDVPDNLKPKHLKRTGRALLLFVRRMGADTVRKLRRY